MHITLNRDGTFVLYDGASGRWSLTGDRLVFSGAGGNYEHRVRWVDSDNVVLTNPDGTTGRSQRCGGGNAAAPQAPAFQGSRAILVGRWGDNGDCTQDIVLNDDGTFLLAGGATGRWSLTGDRLVFTGAGGTYEQTVRWVDRDNVVLTNPDGTTGRSQRCGSQTRR